MRRTLPCLSALRSTAPLFDQFDTPLDERIQREWEDDFAEDDERGPEEVRPNAGESGGGDAECQTISAKEWELGFPQDREGFG
jgi:hypothetical protein